MNNIVKPKNKPILVDHHSILKLESSEVDISDIEERVRAEGYREQTERHVTIIGGATGQLILNLLQKYTPAEQEKYWNKIEELLNEFEWKYKPKDIYHIEKKGAFSGGEGLVEERESYIRAIDMPDMAEFYTNLNKLLNTDILPIQFPHITLFTRGERKNPTWYGIGIGSKEEFLTLNPRLIK